MEWFNMKTWNFKKMWFPLLRNSAAYSLIEGLVAGTLLSLALTASVGVVNTGTQITSSDNIRRQARTVVRSAFEQSFDFRNYNTIPDNGIITSSHEIDSRNGNPLTGQMTATVVSDSVVAGAGTKVPVKRVTLKLKWTNCGNVDDSLEFTKIVASVQ